jgi:hypothetical protein
MGRGKGSTLTRGKHMTEVETRAKREYEEFLKLLDEIENFFIRLDVEEILDNNKGESND